MQYERPAQRESNLSSVRLDETVYAVVGIYLEEGRGIAEFEYGIISAMLNEAALAFSKRYGDFWGHNPGM